MCRITMNNSQDNQLYIIIIITYARHLARRIYTAILTININTFNTITTPTFCGV